MVQDARRQWANVREQALHLEPTFARLVDRDLYDPGNASDAHPDGGFQLGDVRVQYAAAPWRTLGSIEFFVGGQGMRIVQLFISSIE